MRVGRATEIELNGVCVCGGGGGGVLKSTVLF